MKLQFKSQSQGKKVNSTVQAAKVTRPLFSVSKICDSGYEVLFTAKEAVVRRPTTKQAVEQWARRGGLYINKMKLQPPNKSPTFGRQG